MTDGRKLMPYPTITRLHRTTLADVTFVRVVSALTAGASRLCALPALPLASNSFMDFVAVEPQYIFRLKICSALIGV